MKFGSTLFLFTLLFFLSPFVQAQNCGCTLEEVEHNAVIPCDLTIGTVINVSTASELRAAINQANNSGGNMTILLADGTYPIASPSWYPYITASNLVFRSLSGNRDAVIITGTGMASVSPQVENGFYFVGDHITIADLTIREVGNHGIATQGDHTYVHNVKIQNTFEQMLKGTSAGDGADFGHVQCSLFEYPAGVGPQFYIGGLDIHKGDSWIVSDNIFRNIASPSGSVAEHAVHFWNGSSNNTIERNIIINCDRGIGFGLGNSSNDGGMIRNNTIYNDGTGLFNDVGIGLESSPNTKVYNNTVLVAYQNAIEYRFESTTNVDITNNLCNKIIRSRNGGQANLTTNHTNAQNQWFMNPTAGNLRLNAFLSEVVDQGTMLPEVQHDMDQTQRPQYSFFDIGAHEYQEPLTLEDLEESNTEIIAFPNPVTHSIKIRSNTIQPSDIVIYNTFNQVICAFQEVALSSEFEINTQDWPNGTYFCHIGTGDEIGIVQRIVVLNE